MEKFTRLTAVAAPLLQRNVDTDVIIRIERLIALDRKELGPHAFAPLRYRADGSENPDFVLNRPPYRDAKILIAGENFGCGSSREGAVWALWGMGLRSVVAPSFGDIFFNNCFQNGLLPIVLEAMTVERLAKLVEAAPGEPLTVDLDACIIQTPAGERIPFAVDPGRRAALLAGLDEIGQTLQRDGEIAAFQARDRQSRPWIYELPR
jgi:3-isopropylmalate/(R)-2-methylmalate dehydratase small subunit